MKDKKIPTKMYLEERGIIKKYTGCNDVEETITTECTVDNVIRDNKWTGLVGLMSASDILYTGGWIGSVTGWTITPATSVYGVHAGNSSSSGVGAGLQIPYFPTYSDWAVIYPSVYLKNGIKIVGGNGDTEPFKLKLS